jgi:hypothetical protein
MNTMLLEKINNLYAELISPDIENYDGSQNNAEFHDCIEYIDRRIREIDENVCMMIRDIPKPFTRA